MKSYFICIEITNSFLLISSEKMSTDQCLDQYSTVVMILTIRFIMQNVEGSAQGNTFQIKK